MSTVDITSIEEIPALEEAKEATMRKVTDIHETPLLKHGFTRFPSPHKPSYMRMHPLAPKNTNPDRTIDRLVSTLKAGIISQGFADRANIPIVRNWNDLNNERGISLFRTDVTIDDAIQYTTPEETYASNRSRVSFDDSYMLLIESNIPTFDIDPFSEVMKLTRIAPKFFRGIVIFDQEPDQVLNNRPSNKIVDFDPFANAEKTQKIMTEVYGPQTNLYLPIYGNSGRLYWPYYMQYDEVKNLARRRL